jgi:hypothetical protein
MKILPHPLLFRFFVLTCAIALLVGCGGSETYFPGLDSISPDGHSALLNEVQEGTSNWVILNLDTGETRSREKERSEIGFSDFSPDGRYLVAGLDKGWTLFDVSTFPSEGITLTNGSPLSLSEFAEFLPNGDLLLTETDSAGIHVDRIVPEKVPPVVRERLADARWVFPSAVILGHLQSLFAFVPFISFVSSNHNELGKQIAETVLTKCFANSWPIKRDQMSWILLDSDYSTSVLTANRRGVELKRLDPAMSRGFTVLLNQQKANYQDEIAAKASQFETEIKARAAKEGQALSDAEIQSQVAAQIQAELWSRVITSILGLASPDGSSLFFVRAEPDTRNQRMSLFLVPLNGSEFPVPLTTRTDWLPQFGFSPDGKQIYFESNRDGTRGFYVADSDGSNIQRLPIDDATSVCWN